MTLAIIALVDICEAHGNLIKLVCAHFTPSIIVYIYDFDLFFDSLLSEETRDTASMTPMVLFSGNLRPFRYQFYIAGLLTVSKANLWSYIISF